MSILDEFSGKVSRGAVVLRGRAVEARMLGGREQRLLRRAFPQPEPPLRQVKGKGSLSKAPNYDDPAYLVAKEERDFDLMAAELAIACGLVDGYEPSWVDAHSVGGEGADDVGKAAAWTRRAAADVLDAFTLADVNAAYADLRSLGDGLAVRAYAELVGTPVEKLPADSVEVLRVDPDATPSELAIVLDVCARYGQDPAGEWWQDLDEAHKAVLLAHEHAHAVRRAAGK